MSQRGDEQGWIQASVEELAGLIVQAEPANLQLLANLHGRMEEIELWAQNEGLSVAAEALKSAARLIEGIILEDVPDSLAALDVAGRAVSSLQAIVLSGRSPDEVSFPSELLGNAEPALVPPPAKAETFDANIFSEFLARQASVVEDIEKHILRMESTDGAAATAALGRLLHTLKGEAGMLGLNNLEKACHEAEDLLAAPGATNLPDKMLALKDWLANVFAGHAGKGPIPPPFSFDGVAEEPEQQTPELPQPEPASPASAIEGDPALLGEFISESREHLESADVNLLTLETDPANEEAVHSVFRAFHTIKGVSNMLGLTQLGKLAHEAESLLDKIRKHELAINSQVIDVIFETTDMLKRMIASVAESLSSGTPAEPDPDMPRLLDTIRRTAQGTAEPKITIQPPDDAPRRRLGEILVEQGTVTPDDVNQALQRQSSDPDHPRLGSVLVEDGKVAPKEIVNALRAQNSTVQVKETVKVDADRLDRLVEMIGELVIAESMVSQSSKSGEMGTSGFMRHLNELDKITRELQQMGMSLRMVPLRATFQKMARLVRDLSKKSGKQVEFVMAGEDTELDKTVVDRIGDPLVHMVRNAVDHGLEACADDRVRAGKSPTGRVELRAFHKGGNIYIEIQDDGRGLDRDAILAKGRERGLIADGETPSDRDIYNLIFQPGFSTAKKVTDVSGRGVGMDVVKRNIDSLRGQVEIRTEIGKGSTFSIRLPLTLAIIDGMVVRVGAERYIIPTLSVLISIRPEPSQLSTVLGRGQLLSHQGREIPLFRLDEVFHIEGAEQDPTKALAIVVEDDGQKVVLLVDELLGQQQIVIKSLGETVRGIQGISGGAIMPDGKVGLILDVGGVIRLAQSGT